MRKPRRAPLQQGWTLIELVMVVALTSALMMVAVALLHGVAVWGGQAEKSSLHAANLHRLEFALRAEIRRATEITADGKTLTITTEDGQVEFRMDGNHCLQTGASEFERYTIGPRGPWQVVIEQQIADVRLNVPEGERGAPFHVVAALNKESAGDRL